MSANAEVSPMDAVKAMRARGLDNPEELLAYCEPERVLSACRAWDARSNVRPGLLAKWIREGGVQEEARVSPDRHQQEMRERFERLTVALPESAVLESHRRLQRRCRAEGDVCDGRMVVGGVSFPVLEAECDECGLLFGYPLRALGRVETTQERGTA